MVACAGDQVYLVQGVRAAKAEAPVYRQYTHAGSMYVSHHHDLCPSPKASKQESRPGIHPAQQHIQPVQHIRHATHA